MPARHFIDDLYRELLSRAVSYFFPHCSLRTEGSAPISAPARLTVQEHNPSTLELNWLGVRFSLVHLLRAFTDQELKLVQSIGLVLSTRYQFLFENDLPAGAIDLYRGLSEDRFVSAFLDSAPYTRSETLLTASDRIGSAIEVLRLSSMMTYENRRIATGVLLFGAHTDPCHTLPSVPEEAVPYGQALTSIRAFHRLSDGLQTVALVDRGGLLVGLLEVQEWAQPFQGLPLPVPAPARYEPHSRATLCGGHIFLILTPYGEIKIIANGAQIFNFIDGRWKLTDAEVKYQQWEAAVGDRRLAETVFMVAMNLAEDRRGCLLVILDDSAAIGEMVSPGDVIASSGLQENGALYSKQHLHYLLRNKRVLDLPAPVLESVARMDGAIVLNHDSEVLAFGAILRSSPAFAGFSTEGGRTTAAVNASLFGKVLKVSEDGHVSFCQNGVCVWEI